MKKAEIIKKVPNAPFVVGEKYEIYKERDKTQCVLVYFNETMVYQVPRETLIISNI